MSRIPSQQIIHAFGVRDNPELLSGGQQTSYKAGSLVLKPVDDEVEVCWVADILDTMEAHNSFRIAKPIRSIEGNWVHEDWCASTFVEGNYKPNIWPEVIEVSNALHHTLKDIPRPSFLDGHTHSWAIADRMAWQEIPLPYHSPTEQAFSTIEKRLEEVTLPSQLIHGDIEGNLLFHSNLPPAVIDFTPYWRPANFALAVVMIDSLVWKNGSSQILEYVKGLPQFGQLLLRAFLRRICEQLEHERQLDKDPTDCVEKHLLILDDLVNFTDSYR